MSSGDRMMAGRAILLSGLSEMLSKPQAGLTAARLKGNMALGDRTQLQPSLAQPCTPGRTLGSPSLFPVQGEAAEQDKPCPGSPDLLQHTTRLQPKGAWPSCQRQDAAPAAECTAQQSCVCRCPQEEGTSVSPLARDTHEIMGKPFGFPLVAVRGFDCNSILGVSFIIPPNPFCTVMA